MRTKKQLRPVLAEAFGPKRPPTPVFREVTDEDLEKEWSIFPEKISVSINVKLEEPPELDIERLSSPDNPKPETPKPTQKKKKTPKPQQHKDTTPSVEDLELEYLLRDEANKEAPPED